MEFAGRLKDGTRVMGILPAQALATSVVCNTEYTWKVPDSWSLQEAATVPVVYATAYYALIMRGRIRKGDRVLIHGGTGGVGQAAITIALQYGCEVYTTVSSNEKREFLKQRFPQLTDKNFANSRSANFEQYIRHITRGQGVDVVLNSLAHEMLQVRLKFFIIILRPLCVVWLVMVVFWKLVKLICLKILALVWPNFLTMSLSTEFCLTRLWINQLETKKNGLNVLVF